MAMETNELIDVHKLTPFKKFIMSIGAIPTSYLESMTYAELIMWFCNYLQNTVIPTVNNNGEAVEELQALYVELQALYVELHNYVDDYFDNLDVQEEIDHKLEQMLDNETIATILQNFMNLQRIYDTALDMIDDSSIVEGAICQTLGYSTINDTGAGLYKISDTAGDFSITLDNGLYANLVITDGVNVNSLGADYTGTTDSSSLINTIIGKINDLWLANNFKINTVILDGRYLFNSKIILPPWIKLRGNGFVEIKSNISNDSAIHITYLSNQKPSDFIGNKADWLYNEIINFEKGCVLKNINETEGVTTIGVEVGTTEDLGAYMPVSRYKLCNMRIQNYSIGMLHNIHHNYIGKIDNISFETNDIGVQYGRTSGDRQNDSGENMCYHNCLFSTGSHAIVWKTDGWDTVVSESSFDFLTNVFYADTNQGYHRIVCYGCHFEGMKDSFCEGFGQASIISINNSSFVDSNRDNIRCTFFKNCHESNTYILENNKIICNVVTSYDPEKLYQTAPPIKFSNTYNIARFWTGFLKNNDIFYGIFDNIEDGTYTVTSGTASSDINNMIFQFNSTLISNQFEIRTDNYLYQGHKSLVVKSNAETTDGKNLIMSTDYIDISDVNKLFMNAYTKNVRTGSQFYVTSYDTNKKQIGSQENLYHNNTPVATNLSSNEWYSPAYCVEFQKKPTAKFMKLQVNFGNINHSVADPIGTEYIIGGIVGNKL